MKLVKYMHCYSILNSGTTDAREIPHAVLQGKIVVKPGASDTFLDKKDAAFQSEREENRKQMA